MFQSFKHEKARAGNVVLVESEPFTVHDKGKSIDGTLIHGDNIVVSVSNPTLTSLTPNTQVS